jgi:hypothetical protein
VTLHVPDDAFGLDKDAVEALRIPGGTTVTQSQAGPYVNSEPQVEHQADWT